MEVSDGAAKVAVRGGDEGVDGFGRDGHVLGGGNLREASGSGDRVERFETEFRAPGGKGFDDPAGCGRKSAYRLIVPGGGMDGAIQKEGNMDGSNIETGNDAHLVT